MGLMRPYDELVSTKSSAQDLAEILPNIAVLWNEYPLRDHSKIFHWNLLTQWRSSFTCLYMELHRLVSGRSSGREAHRALVAARSLSVRFRAWYACMPIELRYQPDMPIGLCEFQ
jgi:hypothetical protein